MDNPLPSQELEFLSLFLCGSLDKRGLVRLAFGATPLSHTEILQRLGYQETGVPVSPENVMIKARDRGVLPLSLLFPEDADRNRLDVSEEICLCVIRMILEDQEEG